MSKLARLGKSVAIEKAMRVAIGGPSKPKNKRKVKL